jgi:hypothetical protein
LWQPSFHGGVAFWSSSITQLVIQMGLWVSIWLGLCILENTSALDCVVRHSGFLLRGNQRPLEYMSSNASQEATWLGQKEAHFAHLGSRLKEASFSMIHRIFWGPLLEAPCSEACYCCVIHAHLSCYFSERPRCGGVLKPSMNDGPVRNGH